VGHREIRPAVDAGRQERDETRLERADRNWNELLQELRVTQTAVAILFSMLLIVPFSARFDRLDGFGRGVYLATLLLAAASAVLLVGPVAYHRVLFAQGEKTHIVEVSHRMSTVGLGLLALSVAGVILLVCELLVARTAALALAALYGVGTATLWFALPLGRRRARRRSWVSSPSARDTGLHRAPTLPPTDGGRHGGGRGA
jgi:hypothetical protein